MTYNEFQNRYPLIVSNFIQYQGVVRAIQVYQNKLGIQQNEPFKDQKQIFFKSIFEGNRQLNMKMEKQDFCSVNLIKWNLIFDDIDWSKVFEKCCKTTIDCKLKWLQYRILYRVIPTNRYLFIRKIVDSSICDICQTEEEDLEHMFYSCRYIRMFWDNLKKLIKDNCDHVVNLEFSKELVFFGTKKYMFTDKIFDLILLCAKYYIYSLKWSKCRPNITVFHNMLKKRYIIEKCIAYSMKREIDFRNNWLPYRNIIESD